MKKLIFILCFGIFSLFASDLDDGIEAIKIKDYKLALEKLTASCEDETPRACSILGNIYQGQIEKFKDLNKSVIFYKKGCELEDVKSCYNLAYMYKDGEGVDENLTKSAQFFKKGCLLSDGMSCYELSKMYRFGEGVDEDTEKADKILEIACDTGHIKSCSILALAHMKATPQDKTTAIRFATKACKQNDPASCRLLGLIYGDKKDFSNSANFLNLGCTLKDAQSCYTLSFLYARGDGVEKDTNASITLIKKSCDLGFDKGCELFKKIDSEKKE